METQYTKYITQLKNILSKNGYNHKEIFSIINNKDYEEMVVVITDEAGEIMNLIEKIIDERDKIGNSLEKKLNDLSWLNDRLVDFKLEPQKSKTKALQLLKTIYINIYDLEAGQYEKQTNYKTFRKDIKKHSYRCYPLINAKENITLKCFLKKM